MSMVAFVKSQNSLFVCLFFVFVFFVFVFVFVTMFLLSKDLFQIAKYHRYDVLWD